MTTLITGAGGLIGRRLVRDVAAQDDVVAVYRRPPSAEDRSAPTAALTCDLASHGFVDALPDKIDRVIHLAQSSRFRDFPEGATDVFAVNVASTHTLLEHARRAGARQLILASSGAVYAPSPAPLRETDPLVLGGPGGHYAASKLAAEVVARSYADHLDVVILRFFFVYGPGQRPDMLVPRLVDAVRRGGVITLDGAEGLLFNPTFVDDAAAAVARAMALVGSHTLNVAGPEVVSLRTLVGTIAELLGAEPCFETRGGDAPALVGDITKLEGALGRPPTSPRDGLRAMLPPAT